MADLLIHILTPMHRIFPDAGLPHNVQESVLHLNFYCWPCHATHPFLPTDVEKIVYALGADAVSDLGDDNDPECLLRYLRYANSAEGRSEHVEQGIKCRKGC